MNDRKQHVLNLIWLDRQEKNTSPTNEHKYKIMSSDSCDFSDTPQAN